MNRRRIFVGLSCAIGLVLVYLFQKIDIGGMMEIDGALHRFMVNRTIRFIMNDALMLGIIYSLFKQRKYTVFALWVQLTGIIFLLIPYFVSKIYFPSYNGPLISYLHRLILNPTLLILLIPAYYYQEYLEKKR